MIPTAISQLTIDVRKGDRLMIDGRRVVVELLDKSGRLARLLVTAPRDVKIEHEEGDHSRAMRGEMIP